VFDLAQTAYCTLAQMLLYNFPLVGRPSLAAQVRIAIKPLRRSCRDQLDELGPRSDERKLSDVLFGAQD
jgi:hypothetical protein